MNLCAFPSHCQHLEMLLVLVKRMKQKREREADPYECFV